MQVSVYKTPVRVYIYIYIYIYICTQPVMCISHEKTTGKTKETLQNKNFLFGT